ncbi:hypothetical protein MNEG_6514, partial [Monoraphidium neglectum]
MPTQGIADPYSTPFDFCTDATYDAERSSDPPLTPKELATLPPVPAGPAYKADPQTGRRVYRFTTQANCTCSPRSWDHYDPVTGAPNSSFVGCADSDPLYFPFGP